MESLIAEVRSLFGDGAADVLTERLRQVRKEGWSAEHDAEHGDGSLAMAAALYAAPEPLFKRSEDANDEVDDASFDYVDPWPWDKDWDKRSKHSRRRCLEIAGALILAELDRMDREPFRRGGGDSRGPKDPPKLAAALTPAERASLQPEGVVRLVAEAKVTVAVPVVEGAFCPVSYERLAQRAVRSFERLCPSCGTETMSPDECVMCGAPAMAASA